MILKRQCVLCEQHEHYTHYTSLQKCKLVKGTQINSLGADNEFGEVILGSLKV